MHIRGCRQHCLLAELAMLENTSPYPSSHVDPLMQNYGASRGYLICFLGPLRASYCLGALLCEDCGSHYTSNAIKSFRLRGSLYEACTCEEIFEYCILRLVSTATRLSI